MSRKETLRKYRVSAKNAVVQQRWKNTPHGKLSRRKIEAKYCLANKPKINAKRSVAYAVKTGRLPRAYNLPCFDCIGDAAHFHHFSYARSDRLKVVPLCRKCHRLRHSPERPEAGL